MYIGITVRVGKRHGGWGFAPFCIRVTTIDTTVLYVVHGWSVLFFFWPGFCCFADDYCFVLLL